MKKIISILSIIVLVFINLFVLTGCGDEEDSSSRKSKKEKNAVNTSISNEVEEKVVPKIDKTPVDINNKDIYYFKINGKKFTIDNKIKDLESIGFKQDDYYSKKEIEPNTYMTNCGNMKRTSDKYYIFSVTPVNVTDETVKCSDAKIGEFRLENMYAEKFDGTIEICNGITLGTSMEDVEAIFGKPTSSYEGETYIKYTYQVTMYKYFEFEFEKDTKTVHNMKWRYFDLKD